MNSFFAALVVPLALLTFAMFRTIRCGLNLDDEGYLIYGTQAVLRGEIPIRDFRAYDPGRYYWCALWFRLLGPGFITARIAMALLSAGSIVLIVVLICHATGSALVASATACLALVWMTPIYRQVEVFFSIVCCATLYGLVVGIGHPIALGAIGMGAAFFGLNIFVYFVGSAVLVLIFGSIAGFFGFVDLALSFVVGLGIFGAILCAMVAIVPGALNAYFERKVWPLWRRGTTNLPMPRPWVWTATTPEFKGYARWRQISYKFLFTLLPVMCVVSLIWVMFGTSEPDDRVDALCLVAACAGLIYFHHAFSRADLRHIYGVMQPIFILCAALSQMMFGWLGATVLLCLLGIGSIILLRNEADFIFGDTQLLRKLVPFEIGNDLFMLSKGFAQTLTQIKSIVDEHMQTDDVMFAAPAYPGMLALFGCKTAIYDTFPVYMSTLRSRQVMLNEIAASKPKVAIVANVMIDGRQDLLFANNYPEVTKYIFTHYDIALSDASQTIYVRR